MAWQTSGPVEHTSHKLVKGGDPEGHHHTCRDTLLIAKANWHHNLNNMKQST